MTTPEKSFHESLKLTICPSHYNVLIQALWHDGKGDWHTAHDLINDLSGTDEAWIHAYLHRKEGDLANAAYWYKRAGKIQPSYSLETEWTNLVKHFVQ